MPEPPFAILVRRRGQCDRLIAADARPPAARVNLDESAVSTSGHDPRPPLTFDRLDDARRVAAEWGAHYGEFGYLFLPARRVTETVTSWRVAVEALR